MAEEKCQCKKDTYSQEGRCLVCKKLKLPRREAEIYLINRQDPIFLTFDTDIWETDKINYYKDTKLVATVFLDKVAVIFS